MKVPYCDRLQSSWSICGLTQFKSSWLYPVRMCLWSTSLMAFQLHFKIPWRSDSILFHISQSFLLILLESIILSLHEKFNSVILDFPLIGLVNISIFSYISVDFSCRFLCCPFSPDVAFASILKQFKPSGNRWIDICRVKMLLKISDNPLFPARSFSSPF